MQLLLLLIISVFASKENNKENSILVKIEEDEYIKTKSSNYIGVSYRKKEYKWLAQRYSRKENKVLYNGVYNNEETAAHASDTLAKKLIANGEKGHKLNFPDDSTEVYRPERISKYIGVTYNKRDARWYAKRWSKYENKAVYNRTYRDEETAAHASDTLARELIANGEKGHKLNFPYDDTQVYREKTSKYIGVAYDKKNSRWQVGRRSKKEKKNFYNGSYKDEETAARASDTLATKLIANGEQAHKLNFPHNDTDVYREEHQKSKRKRSVEFEKF